MKDIGKVFARMEHRQEKTLSMSHSDHRMDHSCGTGSCGVDIGNEGDTVPCDNDDDDVRHEQSSPTFFPTIITPTAQPHPQQQQQHQNLVTSFFYSPPAMTPHMDYRSKAEIRRAELEALREQKLAQPKGRWEYKVLHVDGWGRSFVLVCGSCMMHYAVVSPVICCTNML